NVTVLNSDIAGFSKLSQSMRAEELIAFLNSYFTRIIYIVLTHGVNIDKFQGDGMLVVFGAPNPMDDHANHAFEAAMSMAREVEAFNRELVAGGKPPMPIAIGA